MAHVTSLVRRDTTSASFVNVIGEYSLGTNSSVLASKRSDGTGHYKQILEFNRTQARELYRALGGFLNSESA